MGGCDSSSDGLFKKFLGSWVTGFALCAPPELFCSLTEILERQTGSSEGQVRVEIDGVCRDSFPQAISLSRRIAELRVRRRRAYPVSGRLNVGKRLGLGLARRRMGRKNALQFGGQFGPTVMAHHQLQRISVRLKLLKKLRCGNTAGKGSDESFLVFAAKLERTFQVHHRLINPPT